MRPRLQKVTVDIIAAIKATGASSRSKVWPFTLPNGANGWIVDAANDLPARKVRPGWQARSTGRFVSKKADRPQTWESRHEYAAFLICEYDPDIEKFRSQPFTVFHQTNGKLSRTFPDIEVVLKNGQRKIIQVKVTEALNDTKSFERLDRDRVAFEACGWGYEIWTDSFVQQQPRRTNLETLHHYRGHRVTEDEIAKVRDCLGDGVKLAGDVYDVIGSRRLLEAALMPLISKGLIAVDLNQRFDERTRVALAA
jgi:hypothetical protein